MRANRIAALAVAALLAAGCGDILREIDHANDLAGQPSGNRPPPAAGKAPASGAAPATPAPPPAAAASKPAPAADAADEGLVARVEGWLGLGSDENARRPPDPNDPMVLCRLEGTSGFMLKSGCINRRGTVVANKGVPH